MNKVKIFSEFNSRLDYKSRQLLENKINEFGKINEIICVSLSSEKYGDKHVYIAAVTYKEN